MEPPFVILEGVKDVYAGYSGGETANPTYAEVSSGNTGHYEAIQVIFNPEKIRYEDLLEVYWRHIDPTDADGQFTDRGSQYKTAIFCHNEDQKTTAEQSKESLAKSGRFALSIVTEIKQFKAFYPAEEYHHDYYEKNPRKYKSYKKLSGREEYFQTPGENQPR